MDVLKILAKLGIDSTEYNEGLSEAEQTASKVGLGIGKGLRKGALAAGAAIGAAAGAVSKFTKDAVAGYADFEQLAGGIETLFGDSAGKVMADADAAFKTAGMSANEYMETSIQSAASLINSLGGDQAKAAEMMNMSITDMADNVNKMGTSMEAVQNAYRGFSRGNFTMLDNLALGFAGTKEGMQELLDKAKEYEAEQGRVREFSIDSYADIVEAIHVVQDNMGITGTTAQEASDTISGSLSAVSAAWQNLIVGIADENANFDELINNLVDSVSIAFQNILPRVTQALQGVAKLVGQLAPVIASELPKIAREVLPTLLESAQTLLFAAIDAIIELLPTLLDVGLDFVLTLVDGIVEAIPELIPALVEVVLYIVEKLTDPETVEQLIGAAFKIMVAIAEGLIQAIPILIEKVPIIIGNLVEDIVNYWPTMIDNGKELVGKIAEGLLAGLSAITSAIGDILTEIKNAILGKVEEAKQWGKDLIQGFVDGLLEKVRALKDTVKGIAGTIKDYLGFSEPKLGPLSNFHTFAPDMMKLYAQGIKDNEDLLRKQIGESFDIRSSIVQPTGYNGSRNQSHGIGAQVQRDDKPVNITLTIDGTTLARILYPYSESERMNRGAAAVV